MKKISLKDIALLAGASPSTVSFVLNGKGKEMRISETLEKKIKDVAKKEGYHPNQVAVSLRTGQSKILGLIVESIGGHFFGALARVIEAEAEKFGYRIIYCSTENDPNKGRDMIRMLSQSQVDGYLITPVEGMENDIKELMKHRKPLVLIDGYYPEVSAPYVLVDNAAGVTRGMTHLIEKGYRKIAYVTVDMDLVQLNQREAAYIAILKKHKLPSGDKLIFKLPYNYDKQQGAEELCAFIKSHNGLDAIFFATNYLGITGLQSIRKLNLRIPDDIAVVCFDDHDIFSLYPPGIDSLQQPVEEIAITAIHLLLKQLGKNTIKMKGAGAEIKGRFVARGSS
ncbi:MAG: LacI family transcriptional regulator [Chitinophagaceae bacterium]|nr:MAG: LacI family transcriptional regulator [Chitinophagaceae bacterium]